MTVFIKTYFRTPNIRYLYEYTKYVVINLTLKTNNTIYHDSHI